MAEKNQHSCTHIHTYVTRLLHTQESSSIYERDYSYSRIHPLHTHILSTQKTVSKKYLISHFYTYVIRYANTHCSRKEQMIYLSGFRDLWWSCKLMGLWTTGYSSQRTDQDTLDSRSHSKTPRHGSSRCGNHDEPTGLGSIRSCWIIL